MASALRRAEPPSDLDMSGPGRLRFETVRPEPGRCWIGHRARTWPGAEGVWTDLGRGRLGEGSGEAIAPEEVEVAGLEDAVYLPPVPPGLERWRRGLAERLVGAGTPVLWQNLPGDRSAPDGASTVWDLLPALVRAEVTALEGLPAGAVTVWPLVAGVAEEDAYRRRALGALAAAGVTVVQPLRLDLTPAERRRLAEGLDEEAFVRLFHGPAPSERELARAVHAAGLEPFPPRAEAAGTLRAGQRRVAAELAVAGEIWLALGRGEGQGQALLRAGRWMDRERHDLAVLARQGRLDQVSWLEPWVAEVVGECLLGGKSELLVELRREYLEG